MKLSMFLPMALMANPMQGAGWTPATQPFVPNAQPMTVAQPMGGMFSNPLMLLALMGDSSGSGGLFGGENKDLLLIMAMSGGLGGGAGGMNSMLPLLLLSDSTFTPKTSAQLTAICDAVTDATKKAACTALIAPHVLNIGACDAMTDATAKQTCYDALKPAQKAITDYEESDNNLLLMMMMMGGMGGQGGGMGGMGGMLPLLLLSGDNSLFGSSSGSGSNNNLLLMMMMMGGMGGQGGMGLGGQGGGMEMMLPLLLLQDSSSSSSSSDNLLLMMMMMGGGMGGAGGQNGQMDPLMMTLML